MEFSPDYDRSSDRSSDQSLSEVHESQIPLEVWVSCAEYGNKDPMYAWLDENSLALSEPLPAFRKVTDRPKSESLHGIRKSSIRAIDELFAGNPEKVNNLLKKAADKSDAPEVKRIVFGVIAGRIVLSDAHPNADNLRIALVDVGKDRNRSIIYGGLIDLEPDMMVPVALSGSVLEGGTKLRKRNWRGEMSEGMLCSATEWGLPEAYASGADRVYVLPSGFKPGDPLDNVVPIGYGVFHPYGRIPRLPFRP